MRRFLVLGLACLVLPSALLAQAYPGDPQSQDAPPPPPDQQQPEYAPPQQYPQQEYPQQAPYPQQQPYPQPYPQQQYPQQSPYPQQEYPQQQPYSRQDQQPYAQPYPGDQQPAPQSAPQGLAPDQLSQLVAPIALYPDALLAQILAASTFPTQIVEADRWRQSMGDAPPQTIADGANAQPWDPSVKALTAFPQVLDNLAQNLSWTTQLGNAYYNQPQDVFDAVQAMRQRAQAAGNLQSTPQETVTDDQGYIALGPTNPQIVYVPTYNPWTVYGAPVAPYPGYSLLGAIGSFIGNVGLQFGPGLVMSAFTAMPWGWLGWGLSWIGHCLFYDHGGWYPHSPYLHDWGLRYGGPRAGWGHPMIARGWDHGYGGGYDRGFNQAYDRSGYGNRGYGDRAYGNRGYANNGFATRNLAGNHGYADSRSAFASRSAYGDRPMQQSFNRMPAFDSRSGYGSAYGRSAGGSAFDGRSQSTWRSPSQTYSRSASGFNRGYGSSFRQPQSSYRSASPSYRAYSGSSGFGRNNFRGYSGARSDRGSFGGSRSGFGGSHFSGGHSHFSSGSHFGGGGHSHGGGGGHSHGGGGHHR